MSNPDFDDFDFFGGSKKGFPCFTERSYTTEDIPEDIQEINDRSRHLIEDDYFVLAQKNATKDNTEAIQHLLENCHELECIRDIPEGIQEDIPEDIKESYERLKQNIKNDFLDLGPKEATKDDIRAVCYLLKKHELECIRFTENGFDDLDCQQIVQALKHNKNLIFLQISGNLIREDGCKCIAQLLRSNTTLTLLDLERNQIGHNGCQAIAEALKENSTLEFLNLEDNCISDGGCQAITEALNSNTSLRQLIISDNLINRAEIQALREEWNRTRCLHEDELYV